MSVYKVSCALQMTRHHRIFVNFRNMCMNLRPPVEGKMYGPCTFGNLYNAMQQLAVWGEVSISLRKSLKLMEEEKMIV